MGASEISDTARSLVGRRMTYESEKRGVKRKTLSGVCVGAERGPGHFVLADAAGTCPAVRFLIRCDEDGKRRWTGDMPDRPVAAS